MKVTQIVKQAIHEKVNELAKPKMEPLQEQLDAIHKEQSEYLGDIKKELKKTVTVALTNVFANLVKNHPEVTMVKNAYGYREPDKTLTKPDELADYVVKNDLCLGFINYKKNEEDTLMSQISDLQGKINKTINDIILELELGGNKATLDSLLKKVKF